MLRLRCQCRALCLRFGMLSRWLACLGDMQHMLSESQLYYVFAISSSRPPAALFLLVLAVQEMDAKREEVANITYHMKSDTAAAATRSAKGGATGKTTQAGSELVAYYRRGSATNMTLPAFASGSSGNGTPPVRDKLATFFQRTRDAASLRLKNARNGLSDAAGNSGRYGRKESLSDKVKRLMSRQTMVLVAKLAPNPHHRLSQAELDRKQSAIANVPMDVDAPNPDCQPENLKRSCIPTLGQIKAQGGNAAGLMMRSRRRLIPGQCGIHETAAVIITKLLA